MAENMTPAPFNLLAADHTGMRVDYRGLLGQSQRTLKRTDPGHAELLRQFEGHLTELGQRWYAGDTAVVDEILQLYCIEHEARQAVAARPAAPAADHVGKAEVQAEPVAWRWMTVADGKPVGTHCFPMPGPGEGAVRLAAATSPSCTVQYLHDHAPQATQQDAQVTAYAAGGASVERTSQKDGTYKWAVRLGVQVLNKQGHWEYEPLPSSRDGAFIERCRFETAQSAIYAAIQAAQQGGSNA